MVSLNPVQMAWVAGLGGAQLLRGLVRAREGLALRCELLLALCHLGKHGERVRKTLSATR